MFNIFRHFKSSKLNTAFRVNLSFVLVLHLIFLTKKMLNANLASMNNLQDSVHMFSLRQETTVITNITNSNYNSKRVAA